MCRKCFDLFLYFFDLFGSIYPSCIEREVDHMMIIEDSDIVLIRICISLIDISFGYEWDEIDSPYCHCLYLHIVRIVAIVLTEKHISLRLTTTYQRVLGQLDQEVLDTGRVRRFFLSCKFDTRDVAIDDISFWQCERKQPVWHFLCLICLIHRLDISECLWIEWLHCLRSRFRESVCNPWLYLSHRESITQRITIAISESVYSYLLPIKQQRSTAITWSDKCICLDIGRIIVCLDTCDHTDCLRHRITTDTRKSYSDRLILWLW